MNHWESPITQIADEISEYYTQEIENGLVTSVSQTIGYTVDKDELIKALNYDRQQYEKGYEDGVKDSYAAVLDKIKEVCFSEEWLQFRVDNGSNGQRDFLINYIEQLQSVTPQTKTGHWLLGGKVDGVYDIAGVKTWGIKCQCDKCGFTTTVIEGFGYYNYCPDCGCRIDGGIK